MKVFTEYDKEECDNVEVYFSYKELKELLDELIKFDYSIDQYISNNAGSAKLGVGHLHFIDCGEISKKSKNDIAFYVNFDGEW